MQQIKLLSFVGLLLISACSFSQQDKLKRPSPPATTSTTIASGASITIDYSKPSLKGRTISKDVEPMPGKVWRTGANEATVFTTTKDVLVEGKPLPAGKYALFTIMDGDEWTIIFNKVANQWGAFKYSSAEDALRVKVKASKAENFAEQFTINADEKGNITLLWGSIQVVFVIK